MQKRIFRVRHDVKRETDGDLFNKAKVKDIGLKAECGH
jgi:hypothetical protein